LSSFVPRSKAWFRARAAIFGAVIVATLSGCDLPAGLGLPTTRSLEASAGATLAAAKSFEMTGSYSEGSTRWTIELQLQHGGAEHAVISGSGVQLEAVILNKDDYFRGQEFLSAHMGGDPVSRAFVSAAGNGWWKGLAGHVPQLMDLTDGNLFRSTFLGQAVTTRIDRVSVDGVAAVDLSGPRAEVFIAAQPPYPVLRVHLKSGVVVDGIRDGDLRYGHYDSDFHISTPANVIDFSNLSTLPPIYTVLLVDTSRCGSPCTVSALLKNLGGMTGAHSPSVITFTMTDLASQQVVATCPVPVQPDVGYNATTRVACTFADVATQHGNAMGITAIPDNSGRGQSPAPKPTSAGSGLACRMPVVTPSQAGWLTFPDGTFQPDARGNVQLPGYPSPPFFWKSYDKAFERWLPVPRDSISPDGQHYAYADAAGAGGGVHVVDVATGANHLFQPSAADWAVLDYEAEGVYIATQPSGPAPPSGLWLLDPSGQHALRQIDNSHAWQYISGGGAWATADPLTGHGPGPGSRLLRLDLQSGVITSWYKRTDVEFVVTGADGAGHPLLQTKTSTNELLLVSAQDSATVLPPAEGSVVPSLSNYIHPVTDAHGLWLGDTGGMVSLYMPTGGIEQVARVGSSDVLVAGGCH
jgi:hypothetical protein